MATRVQRHASESASFVFAERLPAAALRGLVRGYEDFEERTSGPLFRREVAIPDVVVIVDYGEGWQVGEHGRFGSFAGGVHDRPTVVGHDGFARCMQINLSPLGARALLGLPLSELTNRIVPLEDVLGPGARRLAERLHGAGGWDERFAILDAVLLARASSAVPVRPDVAWAWRRLVASRGAIAVGDLAAELGCSRRHLTARFGEEVGVPPKAYARLLRFQRATEALVAGGEPRLAEVAADCGYADQSHLNREFRALAGTTPFSFVQDMQAGETLGLTA